MMRAKSLAQWKDAMRIRALHHVQLHVCRPRREHLLPVEHGAAVAAACRRAATPATPVAGDARVVDALRAVRRAAAVPESAGRVPAQRERLAALCQRAAPVNTINAYPKIEPPSLRLRSQHAIALLDNSASSRLEDVVRLKHSYRMLLADRVKPDSSRRCGRPKPTGDVAGRARAAARSGITPPRRPAAAARCSRCGGGRYAQGRQDVAAVCAAVGRQGSAATPRGLADPARAAESFAWAVDGDEHAIRPLWTWRGATFTACAAATWTCRSAAAPAR